MVALSVMPGSPGSEDLKVLTEVERRANRAAIAACVEAAVASGDLRADTNAAGLSALLEALLLGFSTQVVDGLPAHILDDAITSALAAWDADSPHRQ